MSFQCTVVTPEAETFNGTVSQAILPAHDGLLGILTDRSPLLVKLGTGPLRLDVSGSAKQFFFINGGIAQMKDNKLTIAKVLSDAGLTVTGFARFKVGA